MEAVSETEDGTTIPADVAYVTACALGLAFSEHRGAGALEELITAAGGRWETLAAARHALARYPAEDTGVARVAARLLTAAAASVRAGADASA